LALALSLASLFAGAARAQLGKRVMTTAGTPEDKAVTEIYAASDPAAKIALLDKFMADLGKGEFELLGDQIYVATYLEQKNYPKVYEYGEKVMKLDPNDFGTLAKMVQAAGEAGDTAKVLDFGERAGKILTQYKAPTQADEMPRPPRPKSWKTMPRTSVAWNMPCTVAATKSAAPIETRAGLMERYAAAFPDSPYTKDARDSAAIGVPAGPEKRQDGRGRAEKSGRRSGRRQHADSSGGLLERKGHAGAAGQVGAIRAKSPRRSSRTRKSPTEFPTTTGRNTSRCSKAWLTPRWAW
jgi:hypothetical protein